MPEKLEIDLRTIVISTEIFKVRNYFFKNFDFSVGIKIKVSIIKKNVQSIQRYCIAEIAKNRFNGLWSSQRPIASVEFKP